MDSPQPPLRSERLPPPRDATVPTHRLEGPQLITAPTIESMRRFLRAAEQDVTVNRDSAPLTTQA